MNEEQALKVLQAVNDAYDAIERHDALAKERIDLGKSHVAVLNEIIDEKSEEIRQLLAQVQDWKAQFDIALNERNDAMAESASAKSVHETLVRNLTSMSEFAGKVLRERDGAMAEAEELRRKLHERRQELKPAWVTSEHHEAFQALHDENQRLRDQLAAADVERRHAVAALSAEHDALRAERDEVRQSYCSLMEAYRGGDGRVTANKLGWGYLFEENTNV